MFYFLVAYLITSTSSTSCCFTKYQNILIYGRDCGAYLSVLDENVNVVITRLECHVSAPSCELLKSGCTFLAYTLCTQLTT